MAIAPAGYDENQAAADQFAMAFIKPGTTVVSDMADWPSTTWPEAGQAGQAGHPGQLIYYKPGYPGQPGPARLAHAHPPLMARASQASLG
jgi:hypothetical protein